MPQKDRDEHCSPGHYDGADDFAESQGVRERQMCIARKRQAGVTRNALGHTHRGAECAAELRAGSDSAAAAPARSAGADPTIMSVASVNVGARPNEYAEAGRARAPTADSA
jgi:hypothetical protein